MRSQTLLFSVASACLLMTDSSSAKRVPQGPPVPAYQWMKDRLDKEANFPAAKRDLDQQDQQDQALLMESPNPALPPLNPGADDDDDGGDDTAAPPPSDGSALTISDVLPSSRRINIFSGFTRDIGAVSQRLEDAARNSTILAPDNGVMARLPRKPWEDPAEYAQLGAQAYAGDDGEDRAHANLRRFVEAHVVPESPWAEGARVKTLDGGTVWWEEREGKKFVSRVESGWRQVLWRARE